MIAEFINLIPGVLGRFAAIRQFGLETEPLMRIVYLECERNLALIACVNLEEQNTGGEGYIEIAKRLEVEALEILFGVADLSTKSVKKLKEMSMLPQPDHEEADSDSRDRPSDSQQAPVADKLMRLYVNMMAIRTAAQIADSSSPTRCGGLRNINFKVRLKNIRKGLRQVAAALSAHVKSESG